MKTPCNTPLRLSHVMFIPAVSFSILIMFTGCVSNKYKGAKSDIPPPQMLNVAFAPAPLAATLNSVITYNGPGSWKRDAFWDEYVVTLQNPGSEPVTVTSGTLTDPDSFIREAGDHPWALESESKTIEQKYKDAGRAFVRYTAPGAILFGTAVYTSMSAGIFAATPVLATVSLVALPVYYLGVISINHTNKATMEKEFLRRRLVLPLTLAAGETRTGSFFFPMVPAPRSLALRWKSNTAAGDSTLPLEFLHNLHLKSADAAGGK